MSQYTADDVKPGTIWVASSKTPRLVALATILQSDDQMVTYILRWPCVPESGGSTVTRGVDGFLQEYTVKVSHHSTNDADLELARRINAFAGALDTDSRYDADVLISFAKEAILHYFNR